MGALAGLYIHIPFCRSKCPYCDFTSGPSPPEGDLAAYVRALVGELEAWDAGEVSSLDSVYLGGGTPSLLPSPLLAGLFDGLGRHFRLAGGAEVTIEVNPGTVDGGKARLLLDLGVNRVSLGVQTFDDRLLGRLGRAHSAAESALAVGLFRDAGLGNLNLDLIYGLPGQGLREWEADLRRALEACPEHLSLYALTVEEGTPFAGAQRNGLLGLPPEEVTVAMYRTAMEMLDDAGFEHYEISNWARPGFRCRHNVSTWLMEEYLGAGAGAHGFLRNPVPRRYGNVRDAGRYAAAVREGRSPREFEENLSPAVLAGEALMMGLRLREGVRTEDFARAHGAPPADLFPGAVGLGLGKGWLRSEGGRLFFSPEGLLFSDEVFAGLF